MADWLTQDQRTTDWFSARLGHLTASRMNDAMDTLKNGSPGAKRKSLMLELVTERITGRPVEKYINSAMQWGTDTEPYAIEAYEQVTGRRVTPCGFAKHASIEYLGASPDGLVGDSGLIEVKCPSSTTHLQYLQGDEPPEQYRAQMILQMLVTGGREWVDFVSFDPRYPEEYQLFVKRFTPTEEEKEKVLQAAISFLAEAEAMQGAIKPQDKPAKGRPF